MRTESWQACSACGLEDSMLTEVETFSDSQEITDDPQCSECGYCPEGEEKERIEEKALEEASAEFREWDGDVDYGAF